MSSLENIINKAFDDRDKINANTSGEIRDAVDNTLNQLDNGTIRVCEKKDNEWIVNQWIKKAILLSFRLNDNDGLLTIPFSNVRSLTSRMGDVIYPEAIEFRKSY